MTTPAPHLSRFLLGVLGFTAAVSPLATGFYLSSFGEIQRDLETSASMVQLTLSVFFLGLATGQLVIGPLSDVYGRRRILIGFLSVYVAASLALVFSPSIEVFIALRLVLGFTGSAGVVLARAIAVDLDDGETAVRALSLLAMVAALGPLLAPPLGGLAQESWGWRGTIAVLAAVAAVMLLAVWLFVPETLPVHERRKGGAAATFAAFGSLLRSRRYVGFMLTFAFAFGVMMSYISASPFVGQNLLKMTPLTYSIGFAGGSVALIITQLVNARVAPRIGPSRMLVIGVGLLFAGTTAMMILAFTGALSIATFIVCAFVLTAGTGATMSNASALALAQAKHARGLGAALLGSAQFAVAAVLAPLVGAWGEQTATPMGIIVFAGAVATACCAAIASRTRSVGE